MWAIIAMSIMYFDVSYDQPIRTFATTCCDALDSKNIIYKVKTGVTRQTSRCYLSSEYDKIPRRGRKLWRNNRFYKIMSQKRSHDIIWFIRFGGLINKQQKYEP